MKADLDIVLSIDRLSKKFQAQWLSLRWLAVSRQGEVDTILSGGGEARDSDEHEVNTCTSTTDRVFGRDKHGTRWEPSQLPGVSVRRKDVKFHEQYHVYSHDTEALSLKPSGLLASHARGEAYLSNSNGPFP